jgi:hypothetical protein
MFLFSTNRNTCRHSGDRTMNNQPGFLYRSQKLNCGRSLENSLTTQSGTVVQLRVPSNKVVGKAQYSEYSRRCIRYLLFRCCAVTSAQNLKNFEVLPVVPSELCFFSFFVRLLSFRNCSSALSASVNRDHWQSKNHWPSHQSSLPSLYSSRQLIDRYF